MKKKTVVFMILLVVSIGTGFVIMQLSTGFGNAVALQSEPEQISRKHHSIRVEAVEMMPLKRNTTYPGSTQAVKQTQLAFRIGGPLIGVNVMPGDRVNKGQMLMQIDPKDFNDNIKILEAQLDGAMAREKNARQDLERVKLLFQGKVVPQADFDHASTAYISARAFAQQIMARLETARHQLEYTTLTAPYDGIITSQLVENHEMVELGQVVLKLHDISELEITINVPENEIIHRSLTRGEAGIITFPGLKDRAFPGHLKEWNTQADALTRTYEMTFLMGAPEDIRILPGMTAQVAWTEQTIGPDVITIPARAVINHGGNGSAVWLFNESTKTAARHAVKLGGLNGASRVCVKQGLAPGDLVVIQGMDFITQDMILTNIASKDRNEESIN
ncbi:efflux RND transporter periplasmic adaptor subunit [Desulfobacula phenolica]|uniref:RND family efflux transporter, MFP subunit n=1 Tax=Desulfobacula phenolica TaxID=90732 RepID=A0A1H2IFT7_9BACT|nr:efflux RND transporter periplasmic adaptor subunit [Desulfobacula phenolica]SDU42845.1 RND family efflux transporter, MFP subunit [Desulfobacula phenolica]